MTNASTDLAFSPLELRVYRKQANGSVKSKKYAAGAWQMEAAR